MAGLESQEEDAPKRILFFKPMSWLGQIRSHRRDESWSAPLWQTFFSTSMGAQIPVIAEKPLAACGCRKFKLDALGDHLCTCTAHSGAKKAHDWRLINLLTFFAQRIRLKHSRWLKPEVSIVVTSNWRDIYRMRRARCLWCVLDLRIVQDRFGSSSDPSLNGHLHYPNALDRSINEAAADKIRKYRADYNNNPPSAVSFMPAIASTSWIMPAIASTSWRLHREFIRLLFLQAHRETDRFFAASGAQLVQTKCGLFHYRRAAFSSMLKSRVGNILAKAAALRINLNLDGAPIASKSHTNPSHSQTSRLLTSSLSLGVPVPRPTQCMQGV
jgi:hypothetical protein